MTELNSESRRQRRRHRHHEPVHDKPTLRLATLNVVTLCPNSSWVTGHMLTNNIDILLIQEARIAQRSPRQRP